MKNHTLEIKFENGTRFAIYYDGEFRYATGKPKDIGDYVKRRFGINILREHPGNGKMDYDILCGAYTVGEEPVIKLANN